MARSNRRLDRQFGQVLRARREAAGKSQMQLAEEAGLTNAYISLLERGLNSPSLRALWEPSKALDTTASEIMRDVEKKLR